MRPVLASVASGSVTGALLTLAREASLSPLFHQLQPSVSEVCAAIPPLAENWTLDWTSFGFGLLLGVLLLPLLDVLLLCRLAWLRALRSSFVNRPVGPLHRLLA